jgi:predicted Fe-Mo cluster-binding NifX family protein
MVTVRLSDQSIEKKASVENPHKGVETAKGIRVAEWLVGQNVDQVMMKEDLSRKGPGYVLSNAGVHTTVTSAGNLDEAIADALSDRKDRIEEEGNEQGAAEKEGH